LDERERGGRVSAVTSVSASVEVRASPKAVWEVAADPRNLPRWERHIISVEDVPPDGLETGASYVVVMRFAVVSARVHASVVEWSPPKRAVVHLSGLLDATVTTTVEPMGRRRTRLRHDVEYSFRGGALGDLAARSLRMLGGARLALKLGTLGQKREIESRTPA
jgi:carbon monoxide dehydrogenase subunit G